MVKELESLIKERTQKFLTYLGLDLVLIHTYISRSHMLPTSQGVSSSL